MTISLTRRQFSKAGIVGAALAGAGAAGMLSFGSWIQEAGAEDAGGDERVAHICHQFHCLGGCCIQATVRNGRIVMIEPSDRVDEDDRHICQRGIAEVQHVYSTERIQTPLKRAGERGEGSFVAISWDEAIQTIADAIKESQEKYGDGSFFFRKSTEASVAHGFEFLPMLLHADTGSKWGLDRGQANGFDPAFGPGRYLPANHMSEMSNASTVILLGVNTMESGIVWARHILDAKERGAKVITIDPRFSPTAQKSHQWLPVKPGTDAAVVLGMATAILENKWYDEEYIIANTSMPFLVDTQTGAILGEMEDRTDATTKKVSQVKMPMVFDAASGSARRFDASGVSPTLSGTWVIDGKSYTTQFDLLLEHQKQYSLKWAADVSGLKAEAIETLAETYATSGPAIICFGLGGPDKYTNADVLGHALAIITALTGNYGKPGAGTGWYGSGGAFHAGKTKAWELPAEFKTGDTGLAMYDMPYKENNIHAALTFGDAFTLESGNANKMLEWVKTLDFFAICDIYNSSAVAYADIVLPACSKFECDEDVTDLRDSKNYIALGEKAIDPLFESKTDLQIERLLAAQWGLDHHLPKTYEEFARHKLSEVSANMEGMTFDALRSNHGIMRLKGSDVPKQGFTDQVFATPTTKVELYYEKQLADGQAFPAYDNPDEAFDESPLKATYPLIFMQGKTRYRIHAYYSASSWLQEHYGPAVNIAPEDAKARGIATADDVEVFNDRGSFICRAIVNNSLRKGELFMAETTYSQYFKSGFMQNVTNSARKERCYAMTYGPQIPFNDTLVEVRKATAQQAGGGGAR